MATKSARKPKTRGVTIRVVHGPEVMSDADLRAAEELFARLAVRRFVREHPTMFGTRTERQNVEEISGPPAAAAAVPSAPLGSADGPEDWSMERAYPEAEPR